jgi:hypothetical protein
MRYKVLLAVMGSLLATAPTVKAEQIGALLTGYEEVPAVSTKAAGEFTATIALDQDTIQYTVAYSGLQAPITQSHIHVGQLAVNGSIVIFLCQTATNPDPTGLAPTCPQQGSVSGKITSANVIAGATATQQLVKGGFPSVIKVIHASAAYANVHTTVSIRGQIRTIAK